MSADAPPSGGRPRLNVSETCLHVCCVYLRAWCGACAICVFAWWQPLKKTSPLSPLSPLLQLKPRDPEAAKKVRPACCAYSNLHKYHACIVSLT